MRSWSFSLLATATLLVLLPFGAGSQAAPKTPPPNEISADLGPCSAQITVTGSDAKAVYAAKVATRIQYGLFGVKKLDLEAFTDAGGRLKITNLPIQLKKPMYIHITKEGKEQIVEFKPDQSCEATFDVQLR